MPAYVATTPGLYPLPDWAKEDLADLKGHQKHDLIGGGEDEAITSVYDDVRAELVEVQQSAGLDRVVEGQARWDDMLAHPLAVHDAVETRGIVRYYDNNNFYRDPVVRGELDFDGDVAAELESAAALTEDRQAVLPGPYALADLATDEFYGDDSEFLAAVAEFLASEAAAFPDIETLFLLEPSLVTRPPAENAQGLAGVGPERAAGAVDAVAGAVDADVVVHGYWGVFEERTHAFLLDADVDALGYDLVGDPEGAVSLVAEYGTTDDVALGLVDGQNTKLESPETVAERVEWFDERTPGSAFGAVYLTANTELFYLPENKFEAKLEALAAGARLAAGDATEVTA